MKIILFLWVTYLASSKFAFLALRELFRAKIGEYTSSDSSGELIRGRRLHRIEENNVEAQTRVETGKHKEDMEEEVVKTPSEHASLTGLNDAADEFFDVPEPLDCEQSENGWASDFGPEMCSQVKWYHLAFSM